MDHVHPNWNTSLTTTGFEFDPKKLHGIEGFLDEANRRLENSKDVLTDHKSKEFKSAKELKKWVDKDVTPQSSEYKTIHMMENLLCNDVATIISGYKETSLGNIVKCLTPPGPNTNTPLSKEVNNLYKKNRSLCSFVYLFF